MRVTGFGLALALTAALVATSAVAQQSGMVRVRATIESVNGSILDVKGRDGTMMKVQLAPNAPVSEIVKASLSDIKAGSYLGITAMPQPDGSQKAAAIFIFPPGVHPGEGFHPWDFSPSSTMTNATVANEVSSVDGKTLNVKYAGGEKKIVVPADCVIVNSRKASAAALKPGEKIFIFAAKKQPDGTLQAPNIAFGDYGVWR